MDLQSLTPCLATLYAGEGSGASRSSGRCACDIRPQSLSDVAGQVPISLASFPGGSMSSIWEADLCLCFPLIWTFASTFVLCCILYVRRPLGRKGDKRVCTYYRQACILYKYSHTVNWYLVQSSLYYQRALLGLTGKLNVINSASQSSSVPQNCVCLAEDSHSFFQRPRVNIHTATKNLANSHSPTRKAKGFHHCQQVLSLRAWLGLCTLLAEKVRW